MAQSTGQQRNSAGSRDWYQRRTSDIDAERQRAAADRHDQWEAETRRIAGAPPRVSAKVLSSSTPTADDGALAAGWRGFVDEGTLGAADIVSAGLKSGVPFGSDWQHRMQDNMALQRQADDLDQARHPYARGAGRVAGASATLLAPVGAEAQVAKIAGKAAPKVARLLANANASKRIAPLVKNSGEIVATMGARAGLGALLGGANQAIGDGLTGHQSSGVDYALATARGAAQSLIRNPIVVGTVNGVDAALQASRRGASFQEGLADVLAAGLQGPAQVHMADKGARLAVQSLPPQTKGRIGEALSEARSHARGDGVAMKEVGGKQAKARDRIAVPGGYSVPDHLTERGGIIEAKMGANARLTKRQEAVQQRFPDKFRIDHWLPRDIGMPVGLAWGAFAAPPATQAR